MNDIGGEELGVRRSKRRDKDRLDVEAELIETSFVDVRYHMVAAVHPENVRSLDGVNGRDIGLEIQTLQVHCQRVRVIGVVGGVTQVKDGREGVLRGDVDCLIGNHSR